MQVCKAWKTAVEAEVTALAPAKLDITALKRWPALKLLNLSRVVTYQV